MSHSTASCVSSVQVSAHSAVSSNNSGAGSSYASPHSTSSSSSSRRLRSRSKSLFSLSIASAVGPSSSTNSDTNTRTIINNNQPTSTTTNMINAAKALTRRISSTTLRVMESSTLSTHVTTIPELKQHDLAPISGQVLSDEKLARFDCEDRTLRRKKRLGVAASPTSRPPPVASINSSTLKKQVSVASLKASKPISVSFKLSKRPGTSESEGSAAGDNMGDNVKTNTHDSVFPSSAASPKELAHPDAHIDTRARYPGETADTSSQQIMQPPPLDTDVDRPQQSPTHGSSTGSLTRPSSQTVTPVSVVPAQPNPRIGHPSRPYYSAIRKHHMSAPAPPKLVSPPQSVEVSPANSRPVSTSAHHPPSAFAMQMSAIAPFARRPVSLGAVPSGASSSHVAHGHTNSVGSTTTKGMSVFDLEDENYVDVVDDEEASNSTAPSSYKAKQGKKSHSLSKAFVRGHKRRTWSYGLFSGEEEVARSANFAAKSANHGRRLSHGVPPPPPLSLDRIGVSMSGETELRMTLAMLEQQERAQQQQEAEVEGLSTSPLPSGSLKVLAVPTQSERFRFRHTADFSQQQHTVDGQPTLNENAGPSRTGTPSGSGSAGVMARVRKFKKSFIKGLQVLGSTSATHPAS
ncbi:hypothetical protein FA15DRAFT_501108 [Coprinopsis marcescibilis]|uniref:Uncharacterized protein n=1 Tax=Coprinopsis marcescibilis TaxID=230819 RepID=A0A5C3KQC2_COPMA|nr:hypothetical protein FA15DRAFT_501108 [Coprinopsis marcescibilis]